MARPTKAPGHGPVRLRKDRRTGYYYARYNYRGKRETLKLTGPGGTPITRMDVAEEQAVEIADLLQTGQWSKIRNRTEARGKTFKDLINEFVEKGCPQARRRGGFWSESTRRSCKSTLNRLADEFGERAIADVDTETIEAYLARLRDSGLAKGTRNRHLAILKVLLGKAREWGYVPIDAAREVGTEKVGRKKPRPYREEEVAVLLPELHPRHRSVAEIFIHTGLRLSELKRLLWSDVDFESRTLTVRDPKNEDDRVIPLSQRAFEILMNRRQECQSERRALVVEPHVFGVRAEIRQVITRALKRLRFDPDRLAWLRPVHSLRDTFGTRLAREGIPLDRRMKLMGHRDPQMTLGYGEVEPESLKAAIAATFDPRP